jgi:cystathionine gamma-synthase
VLYWGVRKWLAEFAIAWGLDVEFVDTSDVGAVTSAIRPGRTRLLWVETPANPMWDVTDLAAVTGIAHAADVRVAVDSTAATPVLTRPLELGADLVVHSATKYLNGHSDVLAGAIVTARRDPFWERIRAWRRDAGCVPGPFEAWLLQRGMRTLFVRVRRSSETALAFAHHFHGHPALTAVLYPGLPSHPGHEIAARQMTGGFGGMLSIRVAGGEEDAMAVAGALTVFKRATSLGGVESLVEHRRSTEGASSPVPDDLLRLSIGLESPDDLIADLEAALRKVDGPRGSGVVPPSDDRGVTGADVNHTIAAVLERSVLPSVIARGGSVRLVSFDNGTVTLEAIGSPGAIEPMASHIATLLRTTVPAVAQVRIVHTGAERKAEPAASDTLIQVQRVLDEDVNPMIAAHGGRVTALDVAEGRVRIRMEGGCQGCALAEVTVRQGIERVLRNRVREVVGVVDVTDHEAGTAPFFAPGKR